MFYLKIISPSHVNINNIFMKNNFSKTRKHLVGRRVLYFCKSLWYLALLKTAWISFLHLHSIQYIATHHVSCGKLLVLSWTYFWSQAPHESVLLPPGVSGPLFPNCLCVGKKKHELSPLDKAKISMCLISSDCLI